MALIDFFLLEKLLTFRHSLPFTTAQCDENGSEWYLWRYLAHAPSIYFRPPQPTDRLKTPRSMV